MMTGPLGQDSIFNALDTNNDGVIDREEFAALGRDSLQVNEVQTGGSGLLSSGGFLSSGGVLSSGTVIGGGLSSSLQTASSIAPAFRSATAPVTVSSGTETIRPAVVGSPGVPAPRLVQSSGILSPSAPMSPTFMEQRGILSPSAPMSPTFMEQRAAVLPVNVPAQDWRWPRTAEELFLVQQPAMQQVQQVQRPQVQQVVASPKQLVTAPMPTTVRAQSPITTVRAPVTTKQEVVAQTIVQPPVTVPYVEKVVDRQVGLTVQEVSVMMQQERARLLGVVQDIVGQHMKMYSAGMSSELSQIKSRVHAVSTASDERLVRLEVDRAARGSPAATNLLVREREEVLIGIDSVTKDMRSQYRSLIAGLNSQKEEQVKVDQALAELRRDQRSLLDRLGATKESLQADQQALQLTMEKSVGEIRTQVNFNFQNIVSELDSLRLFGGLPDRVQRLEDRCEELYRAFMDQDIQDRNRITALERTMSEVRCLATTRTTNARIETRSESVTKDIKELNRQVTSECAARLELQQSLDAYRDAYLRTTTELRAELDIALEKLARLESSRNYGLKDRCTVKDDVKMSIKEVDRVVGYGAKVEERFSRELLEKMLTELRPQLQVEIQNRGLESSGMASDLQALRLALDRETRVGEEVRAQMAAGLERLQAKLVDEANERGRLGFDLSERLTALSHGFEQELAGERRDRGEEDAALRRSLQGLEDQLAQRAAEWRREQGSTVQQQELRLMEIRGSWDQKDEDLRNLKGKLEAQLAENRQAFAENRRAFADLKLLSEAHATEVRERAAGDEAADQLCAQVKRRLEQETQERRAEAEELQRRLKDTKELNRQVTSECAARLELQLQQSLDAYRDAYLRTTTELRAELDSALEKLARLESSRNYGLKDRCTVKDDVKISIKEASACSPGRTARMAQMIGSPSGHMSRVQSRPSSWMAEVEDMEKLITSRANAAATSSPPRQSEFNSLMVDRVVGYGAKGEVTEVKTDVKQFDWTAKT